MAADHSELLRLLSSVDAPFPAEELFDHLSNVVFFIKNAKGQYLLINQTLVERCGLKRKSDLIGRTPSDVISPSFGRTFDLQDQRVISSGRPLLSQLELHTYPTREEGWCLTTKLPLRDRRGQVSGLIGVSQDLRLPNVSTGEFRNLASAIAFFDAEIASRPSAATLARLAGLSRYQFDQRMRRVFGLTTGQWMLKQRIDRARRLLAGNDRDIAGIALECGYSDQSAFARQFQLTTGMSPRAFRRGAPGSRGRFASSAIGGIDESGR